MTMYWQEDTDKEVFTIPRDVLDVLFQVHCPTLPVDHAWSLSSQIQQRLPWFEEEPNAGLHIIHGADSGNGWTRPQDANDLLYLSRRTKLALRLPSRRVNDASALVGECLDVAGHRIEIGAYKTRPLSMTNILYSRYVICDATWNEEAFISWAAAELKGMRLRFKKLLSGKTGQLITPDGPLTTRSLMVADLPYEDAVMLQESGLGPRRNLGCGLFLPQKSF